MNINNETIGISAEVAIAESFKVPVSDEYILRSDKSVVNLLQQKVLNIFTEKDIPVPVKHVAEGQNSIDFILQDGTTLSVKTNQKRLDKVAPQRIGQPTSATYFKYFNDIINCSIPASFEEKVKMFKMISINHIEIVMKHYWVNLFECDHLIYFYNIIDKSGKINDDYKFLYIKKPNYVPIWDKHKFKFTKNLKSWGESCTVKYQSSSGKYISIGEFQAHRNRDCLKFRFNMKGLLKLIESGSI
mgnify:CR=1 FL=1